MRWIKPGGMAQTSMKTSSRPACGTWNVVSERVEMRSDDSVAELVLLLQGTSTHFCPTGTRHTHDADVQGKHAYA